MTYQAPSIENSECGFWKPIRDLDLECGLILEAIVDKHDLLLHAVADFSVVFSGYASCVREPCIGARLSGIIFIWTKCLPP